MNNPFCRNYRQNLVTSLSALALVSIASQAFATGFQLNEQSASSIGNAFAAGAAFADDVSAMWWNPAALAKFQRGQLAGAVNVVTPSIRFQNNGSQPATNQPLGGSGGDAGSNNYVPNAYLVVPINPQWSFGLGITVPFGLKTEYDNGWLGRYQALKSEIKTVNINPALSWQVNPQFSIGAGLNYQRVSATLTNNVNYSGALLTAAGGAGIAPGSATFNAIAGMTGGLDSTADIEADDNAWGWNAGFAIDMPNQLRLAAAYRSEIRYHASGNLSFSNPVVNIAAGTPAQLAGTIALLSAGVNSKATYNRGVTTDITIPAVANISFQYPVSTQWEVMGDLQWTGWSSIPQLQFIPADGSTLPAVALNWKSTYKFSLGSSYRYNEQWKARMGIAYDQTPANSTNTTARLPDSNRWWLAVGGEYSATSNLKLDGGLVYIFANTPTFNQNQGSTAGNGLITGTYDANVWIVSLQASFRF